MAAQPALATTIIGAREGPAAMAEALARAVAPGGSLELVGCGTSEHAAMAVAALLGRALPGAHVVVRQAFEAALDPASQGFCLAVSHEGETLATLHALRSARQAGVRTGLLTAAGGSPAALLADTVFATPVVDASWCHTVGFLSPIVAGATVAARLSGERLDADASQRRLTEVLDLSGKAALVAAALGDATRLVIVGSGLDRIAARELALKMEEGAHVPAVGRDLETQLHGHLVSADEGCAVVAVVTDPRESALRAARAAQLLAACRRIGMPTCAIVTGAVAATWPTDLTSAGRLILPDAIGRHPPAGLASMLDTLAAAAVALQVLTVAVAHARGTNPDAIRREEVTYREAAAIAQRPGPA